MTIGSVGQPEGVASDDDSPGTPEQAADRTAATNRAFDAIVGALARADPMFMRRFSAHAPGGMAAGGLVVVLGLVATVVLGFIPLAVGAQLQIIGLLVAGAICSIAMPVLVPLLGRIVLGRVRPLWA